MAQNMINHNRHMLATLQQNGLGRDTEWILLLGMPGSTKTTTGRVVYELLEGYTQGGQKSNIVFLESSKLITAEIDSGSILGGKLKEEQWKMDNGGLVSDKPMMDLLAKVALHEHHRGARKFVADSCIRTIDQAGSFVSAQLPWQLYYFETPEAVSIERIRERALKKSRSDDQKPETVARRLKEYQDQTFPVLNFFTRIAAKRVHCIKATQPFHKRVKRVLEQMGHDDAAVKKMLLRLNTPGHPANNLMMEALGKPVASAVSPTPARVWRRDSPSVSSSLAYA